jgi:hypothetical protein
MSGELTNWISIIGSIASLVGLPIAIWQIRKTRRVAEAAKEASDQTQKTISNNLLIADVSTCTKNLEEIKNYVRLERCESALIRITDLISYLIQIEQRADSSRQNVEIEFEEMLSQLSIIRESFDLKIWRHYLSWHGEKH